MNHRRKNLAEAAAIRLLDHGSHAGEEIVEHSGLAGPVVDRLREELTAAQEVIRSPEKKLWWIGTMREWREKPWTAPCCWTSAETWQSLP
ncbi:MAG: hypothetical protein M0Z41_14690 [Peptococcaceae bacterium]|nr:hypothetical protein [Peptococcaceae bacterium]